jgi:hypothetical protein
VRNWQDSKDKRVLCVFGLPEPNVVFNHRHELSNVRDGITQFGAFGDDQKIVEIIPICTTELRSNMATLIQRLQTGKYKYRGAERTFSTNFNYNSIVTVPSPELAIDECQRLLKEHPEWIGQPQLNRIFMIYTPENDYALDDESSPYYRIKCFLLKNGLPCQMLDAPTLQNPDMKDLNLALNLSAKCGVIPWVLPDAIPDADFFVGLSYTQNNSHNSLQRLMAYANVFNHYGRWLFYSGNTETFIYEDRVKYFTSLVTQTLEKLALSETPSIYFHYSARFSKEDRAAILKAARAIRPNGIYYFVSINTYHQVRFYDSRAESDGSLSRGSYVISSPNQIYLSTTGYNPYRRVIIHIEEQ